MSTMHTEAYPRLVADIGGTNARFALETAPQVIEKAEVLPCKDYDTVVDAAKTYLERAGSPKVLHAAFAIANPILGDWVQMTNHHWAFSIETTRQALGFETLILLNDFTAQALAVTKTDKKDLIQIGGQKPIEFAPKAVIGPGTGLGVSGLVHSAAGWVALAGEGGHTSFPPFDDMEVLIWQYAKNKYGHVSAERFLSGAGLSLIYEALAKRDNIKQCRLKPSEITDKALSGTSIFSAPCWVRLLPIWLCHWVRAAACICAVGLSRACWITLKRLHSAAALKIKAALKLILPPFPCMSY